MPAPAGAAQLTFYDSASGRPLFVAPRNRTWAQFLEESRRHGWPSFRNEELVRANVRVLRGGETVSIDGSHLGQELGSRVSQILDFAACPLLLGTRAGKSLAQQVRCGLVVSCSLHNMCKNVTLKRTVIDQY